MSPFRSTTNILRDRSHFKTSAPNHPQNATEQYKAIACIDTTYMCYPCLQVLNISPFSSTIRLFRDKISENNKCAELPQNDLEHVMVTCTKITLNTYSGRSFRSILLYDHQFSRRLQFHISRLTTMLKLGGWATVLARIQNLKFPQFFWQLWEGPRNIIYEFWRYNLVYNFRGGGV